VAYLIILFVLFLVLIIIIGESQKNKKEKKRKKPNVSKIKDLSVGIIEIKGRLEQIETVISPLTKSNCIGYKHFKTRYNSSRSVNPTSIKGKVFTTKRNERSLNWETVSTDTECKDFYFVDNTGKIKIKGKGIAILLNNINQTDRRISNELMITENLLLQDNREYVLTGTARYNKKNELIIKKDSNELIISDSYINELHKSKLSDKINKYGLIIMLLLIVVIITFINSLLT